MKIISEEKKQRSKQASFDQDADDHGVCRTADLPGSDINVHQWKIFGTILYQ